MEAARKLLLIGENQLLMLEYADTQAGCAQKTKVDAIADVAYALVTMIVLERCAQIQALI